MTALRLAVAAATPLAPDEAYYWVWSRALAPGYLDHPPMVALWIRAGTAVLGAVPLGVRLAGPLAAALGSVLLARAAGDLLDDRRAGLRAAVMLNATLLFGAGTVIMTPDTPLLFFWIATLWALARLQATQRGWWWLVAGAAAGLALDSKYSAVLLAPAILAWLLAGRALRPWLRRREPWLGAALAAALFAPVVAWNAAHGWTGFVHQAGRMADWQPEDARQFVAELIAGQIGLMTPLLAVMFGAGIVLALRRAWRGQPAFVLLAALIVLPAAVFLQHAIGDRVQPNWPAVAYPAAAIAAAALPWRRTAFAASVLGGVITACVYVQGTLAPLRLPAAYDPTLPRLGGWAAFGRTVTAAADAAGATFVTADNYGTAAELGWLVAPRIPAVAAGPRWALFALPSARAAVAGHTGLLVAEAGRAPAAAAWGTPRLLGPIARVRDGMVAERYRLYLLRGAAVSPAAARLPQRH